MSATSDNISEWKKLSDIDYFTQYIKSWLAFNAWMRNRYTFPQDRQIIDEVKSTSNPFKTQILNFLNRTGVESETFKQFLLALHFQLERHSTSNRNERISFTNVFIATNPTSSASGIRNRIDYNVTIQNQQVINLIKNSSGAIIFSHTQSRYNFNDLESQATFSSLPSTQKLFHKELYNDINPKKLESVISADRRGIKIGDYYFIDNPEKIAQALIEILYSLRNILFHAEIVPDKDKNEIYNPAYFILKSIIKVL